MGRHRKGNEPTYEVGWGKPPVAHRFSSDNQPRRAPSRFANGRKSAQEIQAELITVRQGGAMKQITGHEAIIEAMINDALRNAKAARALYAILDREERALPPKPRKVPADIETELRSLVRELVKIFIGELNDCAEARLIERGPDDQWMISGWVRQAAARRPPAPQ